MEFKFVKRKSGSWDAEDLKVQNVATPVESTDAVNKEYCDSKGVLASWTANDAIFAGANKAGTDTRNELGLIVFDDTTDEDIHYDKPLNRDYAGGSLIVDIDWMAASATSGDVKWNVQFAKLEPDGQDVDSWTFASVQTATSTTNGTSGKITRTSITLTQAQADGVDSGDFFRLRVTRDADDGADTMVGDAQIPCVQVRNA